MEWQKRIIEMYYLVDDYRVIKDTLERKQIMVKIAKLSMEIFFIVSAQFWKEKEVENNEDYGI